MIRRLSLLAISIVSSILLSFVFSQGNRGKEPNSGDYENLNLNRTISLEKKVITVDTKLLFLSLN